MKQHFTECVYLRCFLKKSPVPENDNWTSHVQVMYSCRQGHEIRKNVLKEESELESVSL